MNKNKILVTGGAGYIGSHVVKQLGARGEHIIILDNLSTGFKESILSGELIEGDTGDMNLVSRILQENNIKAVLHFAAHIVVPESVTDPLKYYRNNTCNTRNLLECCARANVEHFIFSSTAAVYGMPDETLIAEGTPVNPINPYGNSKRSEEHTSELQSH